MKALAGLLVDASFLEEFRLGVRRQSRTHLRGEHVIRRMGQSLEFREHTRFSFGDDVRHIDWRVSTRTPARLAPWESWHIRRFMAEGHMKVVISLDTRETMTYPSTHGSKLQVAFWLAQAISYMALRSRYGVTVHRLFGPANSISPLEADAAVPDIAESISAIIGDIPQPEVLNLADLGRHLPPAAVWLIVTDLYFGEGISDRMLAQIRRAQEDRVWVILVDLDSWPAESTLLGRGPREVVGPMVEEPRRLVVENKTAQKMENGPLGAIRRRIQTIKTDFQQDHLAYTTWEWPKKTMNRESLVEFCQNRLREDAKLRELFMQEK